MRTTMLRPLLLLALTGAAGCAGEPPDPTGGGRGTSGGTDNTFDHFDDVDVWDLMDRIAEEGPPRYTSRLHSCAKVRYATVGRILASRGVDLASDVDLSAGKMWRESAQTMGGPAFAARQRENAELTTASASRLFDIFVQAAPEIIAGLESSPACGVPIFDGAGACSADGISCLIGSIATPAHVALCQEMVARATTPEKGRVIAVAALAAAAHTCE